MTTEGRGPDSASTAVQRSLPTVEENDGRHVSSGEKRS